MARDEKNEVEIELKLELTPKERTSWKRPVCSKKLRR